MEPHELFALRRQAREAKRQNDLRILDNHRRIADLLYQGDELSRQIRAEALEEINAWEAKQICSPYYVTEWRQWLDFPEEYFRAAALREDDIGVSMRQNSPFGKALARLANQGGQAPVPKNE